MRVCLAAAFVAAAASARFDPTWASLDTRVNPAWYDEAKVGIFIVGGVFSVPSWGTESGGASGEWFENNWMHDRDPAYVAYMADNYAPSFTYTDFAASLKYDLFNATEWAQLFKASGARYTVFLTKHHDGFTLWPSNTSARWNAVDVGPRIDVVGAVSAAVKAVGLHSGLYHSLFEWNNPLWLADQASNFTQRNFVQKTFGELYDLVDRYQPDLFWSDGDWDAPDEYWNAPSFLAWLANDSPVADSVVWNDRWGKGTNCKHGSYWTCQDRYSPGKTVGHKVRRGPAPRCTDSLQPPS